MAGRCLLVGHAPVEMAAAPDVRANLMANRPQVFPGQPVTLCARCGAELFPGPIETYLALNLERDDLQAGH